MVAGLEEISEGEISIGDRVVNNLEPAERDIAMVFQNYALYPHMSVFDNMAYGLKIKKVPIAEIKTRVDKAAGILELGQLLERKPRQLSGGQRQRVAMGRAIVRQPQVFLFDEPLSNLDAKLRAQTRIEIQKLHRELGITSLFVTHDQVEAMTLAQRMLVMNAGVMEQFGTPEEVYHRPASTFVASFIGSPPMNLLKNAPGARPGTIMGVRPEHLDVADERLGAAGGDDRTAGRRAPDLRPPGRRAGDRAQRRRAARGRRAGLGDPRAAARRPRPLVRLGQRQAPGIVKHWPYPRWIAHRGAGKLAPENTLAAFRAGRQPRLPDVRVRRQALGRRRAVPDARHHAGAHHQCTRRCFGPARERRRRRPRLERAVAAGRRQLALAGLCRRAPAHAGERRALLPGATATS